MSWSRSLRSGPRTKNPLWQRSPRQRRDADCWYSCLFKLFKLAARKRLISGLWDVFAVVVSVRNRWVESKKKEGKENLLKKHTGAHGLFWRHFSSSPQFYFLSNWRPDNGRSFLASAQHLGNHGPEDSFRTCLAASERQRVPLLPACSPHMGRSSHWGLKIVHEGFSIIQATLSGRGLIIKPECLPPL